MSDHQINNEQTQDMNIDNIDDNEDLDAFLVLLESRLRADFTSPDLSRIISSQGTSSSSASNRGGGAALSTLPSGNLSSPTKFIRLIYKVFTKAGKPIKLRSILSVLGLDDDATIERDAKNSSNVGMSSFASTSNFNKDDSDELQDRKTDEVVYKLLTKAEEDDEKWVRVIAGIIKRIMFSKPSTTSDTTTNTPKEKSDEKKESESDKQLRKIITNILSSINKTSTQAEQRYNEAKLKLYKQIDEESTDEIEVQQKQSSASNTLSTYLIGSDLYPTYVPLRYTLLPNPSTINSIIPNVNMNVHFTSNMNANVLKVDAEVDTKRAEEEGKGMLSVQQKQQVSAVAATNGNGAGGRVGSRTTNQTGGGAVLAGRMRGRFSNTAGRGSTTTSGSSLFRPSTTGRGSAAGRTGVGGGRAGRISGRGGGRLGGRTGGRVGSLARLTGGRGTTTGRGSMSAPLQRRVPGAARAILNSTSGRGRGTISGKASGGGGGEKTKMKMIDASEVEGLTRQANEKEKTSNMTSVQARKLERKRKLMETAKASGLRGREKKIAKTEAVEVATTGNDQAAKSSTTSGGGTNASQNESTNVTAAATSQQVQPQQQPPSAAYISLLEKSNKLTPEDRQTILLFFQNRNPVQPGLRPPSLSLPPGADEATGVFKVKINEEKTFDESTNENVKETLYLELNYKTLGFKKTRKIKRK